MFVSKIGSFLNGIIAAADATIKATIIAKLYPNIRYKYFKIITKKNNQICYPYKIAHYYNNCYNNNNILNSAYGIAIATNIWNETHRYQWCRK